MCSGNCCGGGSALLLYIVGYFVALCGGGAALPPTGPLMYIFDVYIYSEKICLLVQHVLLVEVCFLVTSQTSTSRVPSE
jgi:hypothetical protein